MSVVTKIEKVPGFN